MDTQRLHPSPLGSVRRRLSWLLVGLAVVRCPAGVVRRSTPKWFARSSSRSRWFWSASGAKLGIEGKDVKIEQVGDKKFLVTVPEFIFIGHDKEQFKVAVESNGVLSFTTPEIDTAGLITELLSDDARREHVNNNRETLERQAASFYTGIIKGIDQKIDVEVKFRSGT